MCIRDSIEGDQQEVEGFFKTYNDASKSFLSSYMYQWDAMPILSLLGQKQAAATLEVAPQ